MANKNTKFLKEYLNNASPTGFEASGQKIWLNYINEFVDETYTDTYGTAVAVINPKAKYKVVIEAHADEISWFVNYVTKDGYIYVIRNGGSDHQIAPSKRVDIHTEKGIVKGVFGWPAIHVRPRSNEKSPTLENIFIDIGAESAEEVAEMGVEVGNVITFDDELTILNKKYYVGRALDNRMGGYMIAEVARKLAEGKKKLPFGLYIVNAVQEEIGLHGAQMIAHQIKPDVAIVTDVTHDTQSPMYDKKTDGDLSCGKGPVLTYGATVHGNVVKMVREVANKKKIAVQLSAASRSTGTDTDAFALSNEGVASALISLPLKYMHTTVETAHKKDVDDVIQLIHDFLVQLKDGHEFKYIK